MILKRISIKILMFILTIGSLFSMPMVIGAQIYFNNIEIYDMADGSARLKWDTLIEPTRATVYYGEIEDNLSRYINYSAYESIHEVRLRGLQANTNYYYKIVAENKQGKKIESLLNVFSTRDMEDTIHPEFLDWGVTQTTKDAALIWWTTNELTSAEVNFGFKLYDLEWSAGYGGLDKYHEMFLYRLYPGSRYHVKVIASDEAGNKQIIFFEFITTWAPDGNSDLKIYSIEPNNMESDLLKSNKATLKWKTNLAAKSKVYYGVEPGRYGWYEDVSVDKRSLEHQVTIDNLEPDTVYYYEIEVYDSVYNKSNHTDELTFSTLNSNPEDKDEPQILIGAGLDSDGDKLSDYFEIEVGTDKYNPDSDGDGYDDGEEISHGYDPLIPGSGEDAKLKIEYYFRPKLPTAKEAIKEEELRRITTERLGRYMISNKNWKILTSAYIYGQYPVEAIVQAMKFGGFTVHPTINWTAWKTSWQYQEYIGK